MFVSKNRKFQKGMAATEYIIGLILIAVGSVGVFAIFGGQIRNKVGQITAAVSGEQQTFDNYKGKNAAAATAAETEAKKASNMNNGDLVIGVNGAAAQ